MNRRQFSIGALALALWGCDSSVTRGTNDETSTFVLSNGTPAANASVTVYPAGSTDTLPAMKTYTNAQGVVALNASTRGYYNVMVRDRSGEAVFIDSVFFDGTSAHLPSDTLRGTGSVKGRLKVQDQDDPRIAWVALLGAGVFGNVDDSGRFLLAGVPGGKFTLVARTDISHPSYTSTFRTAVVRQDSTTDLGTIELVWTGLPLVTGIGVTWDSLGGTVLVRWDKAASPKVAGYRVYRTIGSDPGQEGPLGFVDSSRTSWRDSLFTGSKPVSADTLSVRYRVVAVGSSSEEGAPWHAWNGLLRSPLCVAQLHSTWTEAGSAPAGISRLDTLAGGLAAITGGGWGETAVLWIRSNGGTWNRLKDDLDSSRNFAGGLQSGVSWNGRWWWVKGRYSGRLADSVSPIYPPFPLADSLVVFNIGAGGDLDSAIVPAASDSVDQWQLVVDSAGLVLAQGSTVTNPVTSMQIFGIRSRRLLGPGSQWSEGPYASWYTFSWGFNYGVNALMPSPTPHLLISPSGRAILNTTGGLYLDSLVFQGAYYSLPATPDQWHLLQNDAPGSQSYGSGFTWWRGQIWAATGTKLWTVTIP